MTFIKNMRLLLLAVLLILCVSAPKILLEIQENSVVNRVQTETLKEGVIGAGGESNLCVKEKLSMILNGRTESLQQVYESYFFMNDKSDIVEEKVKIALKELADRGILPEISPEMITVENYTCVSYTNSAQMNQTFSVWMVMLDIENRYFSMTIDSKTGQIYEFDVAGFAADEETVSDGYDAEKSKKMVEDFREYLGLTWEEFTAFYDLSGAPEMMILNRW